MTQTGGMATGSPTRRAYTYSGSAKGELKYDIAGLNAAYQRYVQAQLDRLPEEEAAFRQNDRAKQSQSEISDREPVFILIGALVAAVTYLYNTRLRLKRTIR